jgi:hypothetical protein
LDRDRRVKYADDGDQQVIQQHRPAGEKAEVRVQPAANVGVG